VTIWLDLTRAVATDELAETVHYGELAELAAGIIAGPPRDLIEAVAGEIAETLMARYPVYAAEVTVHKPFAPIPLTFTDVSVTVRRSVKSGHGRQPAASPAASPAANPGANPGADR